MEHFLIVNKEAYIVMIVHIHHAHHVQCILLQSIIMHEILRISLIIIEKHNILWNILYPQKKAKKL